MKKSEIIIKVADAIDKLYAAQPGRGTCAERSALRHAAGEILESLPTNWGRRVPDDMLDQLTAIV